MAYFNALYAWPSLNALTYSGPFEGAPLEGNIVALDPADGLLKLAGAGAAAGKNLYITFYNSSDYDIASVDGDKARFPNSNVISDAAGTSGGNLATLQLQDIEAETDQYVGTPAVGTELTVYGIVAGDNVSANYGKLRAAAAGERVIARVTKAAAALKEDPSITVLTVKFGVDYPKA